ncbi:MAG: hypothetical protein ACYCSS_07620 [Sulfuriferula sp.]
MRDPEIVLANEFHLRGFMNDKPNTETDTRTPAVSDLENPATTPPMAPIDPFLGFRVDKKERDALFYRWFWRGAALSIAGTILIGANIHEASIVVWSTVGFIFILILVKQKLIGDEETSLAKDENHFIKDHSAALKKMAKTVAFVGGHAIGLITISFLMHIMIPFFKHILKI